MKKEAQADDKELEKLKKLEADHTQSEAEVKKLKGELTKSEGEVKKLTNEVQDLKKGSVNQGKRGSKKHSCTSGGEEEIGG